ncbi:MAG: RNA polymerase sigma factor [Prevotella sp.]
MKSEKEHLLSAFTSFRNNLMAVTSRFLNDDESREDALQEAFCRLWQHHSVIDNEKDAMALAVTTVRNICVDEVRKRKPEISCEPDVKSNICSGDSPELKIERYETFRMVEDIINRRLTDKQREILQRREYNGESIEQIALALGMHPSAVRMHLSRARKEIRTCYKQMNHE